MVESDTRYGRLVIPDPAMDLIGGFLERYGEWAWCETSFVASILPERARVLDVGAFVGTFGLGIGLTQGLDFLCCVEANPLTAAMLRRNISARSPCRSMVLEALVAAPEAKSRWGHTEPGNLGSTVFSEEEAGSTAFEATARATTLKELREEFGPFDLVKLDVEGMELEVLNGDQDHLRQGGTTVWVECNEDYRSLQVAECLLGWNVEVFYFAFPSFNRDNFKAESHAELPFAFEAGLLAAPKVAPRLSLAMEAQGCILRQLERVADLRDALWRTPRWGMPAWEEARSKEELAALVCRSLRDESFESFLQGDADITLAPPQTIWQRLRATQEGLQEAQHLAFERLERVDAERLAREQAELVLDETREALAAERQRASDLQADVERALVRVSEQDARVIFEQRRARIAETEMTRAATRALAHLAELGAARDRLESLQEQYRAERAAMEKQAAEREQALVVRLEEQGLAWRGIASSFEQRAILAESEALSLRSSTIWRVSRPMRSVLGATPKLRARWRRVRGLIGRARRAWKR